MWAAYHQVLMVATPGSKAIFEVEVSFCSLFCSFIQVKLEEKVHSHGADLTSTAGGSTAKSISPDSHSDYTCYTFRDEK